MTTEELDEIERVIQGEDHPGDTWMIDTIQRLVDEIGELQIKLDAIHTASGWTTEEVVTKWGTRYIATRVVEESTCS